VEDDDLDTTLFDIGPRLRALRHRHGMTLTALSEVTGLSIYVLSRLESGKRRPTLELLIPLARAHRVALDELVGAPSTGDPRVHLTPQRRFGSIVVPLTRYPGPLQAYKQLIPPRGAPELVTHPGYEWLYVLAGELRLILGEHDLVMRSGEVAEFDTHTPHWFGPADGHPVEILSLFGPQGEKAHIRARPAVRRKSG